MAAAVLEDGFGGCDVTWVGTWPGGSYVNYIEFVGEMPANSGGAVLRIDVPEALAADRAAVGGSLANGVTSSTRTAAMTSRGESS